MSRRKQAPLMIGPLSPKGTGQHQPVPQFAFNTPDKFCNASMPAVKQEDARRCFGWFAPSVRPGADDFLRHPSKGWA